jgi:uncharacterized protein
VGFAWLNADAPFSDYVGHDRTITLIEGPGFALDFGPSHPELVAHRPYLPFTFDGGWAARCRVPDGPCIVLNAMTARAAWTHSVTVPGGAAIPAPAPGGVAYLVVLDGTVTIGGQEASAHDSFRIEEAVTPRAAADARTALIRIAPVRPGGG